MAVLEYSADCDGELAFAFRAIAEASADFLCGICRDGGKLALRLASALGADNAIRPPDAFQMTPRNIISGKPFKELNQGNVFQDAGGLHAQIFAQNQLFVKCIIPQFKVARKSGSVFASVLGAILVVLL
jgi:hypothetical protein